MARFGDFLQQLALVLFSTLLFIAVTLFAFATTWAERASDNAEPLSWWASADVGTTILTLQVLQGLLAAASTAAVSASFERLQWLGMQKEKGLALINVLAMSPTTSGSGTLRIILGRYAKMSARGLALARGCLSIMPWLAGVLLFAQTSLVTVFDTAAIYNVTSGIGPFNASYVDPFIQSMTSPDSPQTALHYSYYSNVHNLITNPLFSSIATPPHCTPTDDNISCASYILTGGLSLTAPWTPPGHASHPLVRIRQVPSIQLDFHPPPPPTFPPSSCTTLGSPTALISAKLCLHPSPPLLHAGLFLCDGTLPHPCPLDTTLPLPNITTAFTLSSLTTTLLASRSNLTILSLSDLSPPTPLPFTPTVLAAYRAALVYLLDYSAAGIPPPSSILEVFWSARHSLPDPFLDGIVLQQLRSVLAFPVWLFNANNYGNTALEGGVLNPGLPGEFYTRGEVVRAVVKLDVERGFLVGGFVVVEGMVLIALWLALGGLFWPRKRRGGGRTTEFPVVDLLFGAEVRGVVPGGKGGAESAEVVRRVMGVRLGVVGDVDGAG